LLNRKFEQNLIEFYRQLPSRKITQGTTIFSIWRL
jgi:hypothetical protein